MLVLLSRTVFAVIIAKNVIGHGHTMDPLVIKTQTVDVRPKVLLQIGYSEEHAQPFTMAFAEIIAPSATGLGQLDLTGPIKMLIADARLQILLAR
jgi:hypothetical protein